MKLLMLGSLAATALTIGIAATSAQSPEGNAAVTLTPEQRDAIRNAIRERLAVEVREGLSDRLMPSFGQTGGGHGLAGALTPEQRAAVRGIIRERLADEMRERMADRIADRLAMLTPEQRD